MSTDPTSIPAASPGDTDTNLARPDLELRAPHVAARRRSRQRRAVLTCVCVALPLVVGGFLAVRTGIHSAVIWREALHLEYLGARVEWSREAGIGGRGAVVSVDFGTASRAGGITDAELQHLAQLEQLEVLDLSHCERVTDAGLKVLAGLKNLRGLYLGDGETPGPQVSDAGLEHIKSLTRLKTLSLAGIRVTDAGLARLKGLTDLEYLDLNGSPITDAGLATIKQFPHLKSVFLERTLVTAQAALDLQRSRSDVEVHHEILVDAMMGTPGAAPDEN